MLNEGSKFIIQLQFRAIDQVLTLKDSEMNASEIEEFLKKEEVYQQTDNFLSIFSPVDNNRSSSASFQSIKMN